MTFSFGMNNKHVLPYIAVYKKVTIVKIFIFLLLFFCWACTDQKKDFFSYNLLPVEKYGKWGYIDHSGNLIIKPNYLSASLFAEGLAIVSNEQEKKGFIDKAGNYQIAPTYVDASIFSEGLAFVTPENHVPSCIDNHGNIVFQLYNIDEAFSFSEGLSLIRSGDKYGYISKSGKIAIEIQFEDARSFSNGVAAAAILYNNEFKTLRWGYISKTGKWVIPPSFNEAGDFNEEIAFAKDINKNKWGIIDKKGKYIINPQFDEATYFSEKAGAVKMGNSWGFVDKVGHYIINPQFIDVLPFQNGITAALTDANSWIYIDKKAKKIINKAFQEASPFFNQHALVIQNGALKLLDKNSNIIILPDFSENSISALSDKRSYKNVSSNFFDATLIADVFMEESYDTIFKNMNEQTEYQDIINNSLWSSLTEVSRYEVETTFPIEIVKNLAFVGKVNFEFQTPFYRTEPKYYYGHKIDEIKIYQSKAQLESVTFFIYLTFSQIAQGKEQMLYESLKSTIYQRYNIISEEYTPAENTTMLTSNRLNFMLQWNNDQIIITVTFTG